jgi:NADH-quinone oxidoreductase subunit N
VSDLNIVAATPPIIIGAAATVSLSLGLLPWRRVRLYGPGLIAGGAIVAAMIMSALLWGDRQVAFDGNLYADRFSLLLNFIFLTAGLAAVSMSWREPSAVDRRGEYSGLLLMSIAGMMLVAGAGDLIVLFLGIELLSIGLYVLCALEVWRERSLESGLKYLIVGSVGSAFFLYGLALLFGSTGSVKLQEIGEAVADTSLLGEPMLLAAMAFIVVGLGLKASAAPFHMWTPDVYEGAPTTITAFMATATKAAAIAAFLRIFQGVLPDIEGDWQAALATIAVASVVVGNLAALVQRNMKRLLAYSSVAQAGYLLIGITAGTIEGAQATLYYLIAYLAMTLAAFAVVIAR